MTGWILVDTIGHGKEKTPFDGFVLASGATVTVHTGNGQNSDTDRYMGYNYYIWNNEGDTATLKDNNGNVVDQKTCNQGNCEY